MKFRPRRWSRVVVIGSVLVTTAAAVALPASGASTTNVNVVGYSVVGPALKAEETAFQATSAGQNVTFTNSIGASDTETTNVVNGLAADVVNLSYYTNMATLVQANHVPANWANQETSIAGVNPRLKGAQAQTTYPTPGMVTDSTVVFIVRAGNPLGITKWSQLTGNGVQIVTPNPATSGSAKWNLLAAYAAWIATKHTPDQAQNFLKSIIEHTVAQPPSGSTALSTFLAGTGNVLLDYEDDAIAAVKVGDGIQVVVPPQTLLIENPLALTYTGLQNPAAVAFYKFLFSVQGQTIFGSLGYRPVLKSVWADTDTDFPEFQTKTTLLTVVNLSGYGWPAIEPKFFGLNVTFPKNDPTHPETGIVTYLEQFAGQASQ
ncbi:MAG: substrate-binding domain-containing protein [Acidimicrobiales bacterium]